MYKHQMEMRGLQHNVVHTFYHKISDSSIPDQGSSSYIYFLQTKHTCDILYDLVNSIQYGFCPWIIHSLTLRIYYVFIFKNIIFEPTTK